MNATTGAMAEWGAARRTGTARYFFVALGLVYLGVAIAGFTPGYRRYLAGARDIHWFAHVHGALMMSWLLFYLSQVRLALVGSIRVHRTFGLIGVVLATVVWLSMCVASVRIRLALAPPVDSFLWDVFAREVVLVVLFPTFFVWALLERRDPETHKRLMTFATAVLLQAAVDRIPWLRQVLPPLLVPFALHALLAPLIVFDLMTLRRVHRVTLVGICVVLAGHIVMLQLAGRPAWRELAHGAIEAIR